MTNSFISSEVIQVCNIIQNIKHTHTSKFFLKRYYNDFLTTELEASSLLKIPNELIQNLNQFDIKAITLKFTSSLILENYNTTLPTHITYNDITTRVAILTVYFGERFIKVKRKKIIKQLSLNKNIELIKYWNSMTTILDTLPDDNKLIFPVIQELLKDYVYILDQFNKTESVNDFNSMLQQHKNYDSL